MNDEEKEVTQKRNQNEPRTYSKPEVTTLGNLEDLTQNVGLKGTDGLSGSTVM